MTAEDPLTTDALLDNIAVVRGILADACRVTGRDPSEITLVAVTKGHLPAVVRLAARAGLTDLGENYVTELEQKRGAAPGVRWHFLGRVQSNKALRIAASAELVHGLEPGSGAERLAAAARRAGSSIGVLLQVDFTSRRQGVAPDDVPRALETLGALEGVEVRGLMTVAPNPAPGDGPESSRRWFAELRDLRDRYGNDQLELSMGMSGDFPVAVEEGATMVRIGTALFGARPTM